MSDDRIPPTPAEQTTDHTGSYAVIRKPQSVGYSEGLLLPAVDRALDHWQATLERVHHTGSPSALDYAAAHEARAMVTQAIAVTLVELMGPASTQFNLAADGSRYRALKSFCEAQFSASITLNGHRPSYAEPNELGPIELHWYPDTGIGFCQLFAKNLDALADYVIAHPREMEGWEEHER